MALRYYFDEHIPRPITAGLRHRGVDVLTVQEDGCGQLDDTLLLDRAITLGRVMFSQDVDFLAEACARQRDGREFAGVVYTHQLRMSIGTCIEDLVLLSELFEPDDMRNRVEYLPL